MNILSDAEYRQLTEAEKTAYWRARYEEVWEQADGVHKENVKLRYALIAIDETTKRALSLQQ